MRRRLLHVLLLTTIGFAVVVAIVPQALARPGPAAITAAPDSAINAVPVLGNVFEHPFVATSLGGIGIVAANRVLVPRSAFRRTLKIEDVALHRGGRYGTRAEIAALYGSLPGAAAANSRLIDMGGSYDTATKG